MKSWFVLNTKPKKEYQVERLFEEGGLDFYCPKYIHETKKSLFSQDMGSSISIILSSINWSNTRAE